MRQARTFRSIAVTASIHNALLIKRNDSLKVLLEQVKELSGVIAARVEVIMNGVDSVRDTLGRSLSRMLLFEEKQQAKSRSILDNTTSVLCTITEKYGFATALVRNIADRSEEISRLTEDIVTSVQFHDITSQMFQGVKKALKDLHQNSLPFYDGHVFIQQDANFQTDMVPGAIDCLRQQSFQLARIRDTFITAVNGIAGSLGHISSNIAVICGDIKKMEGSGNGGHRETFLTGMGDMLSSMTVSCGALTDNARTNREISATILSITHGTIEMAGCIADIEEITDDMQLIAINAEIEASRSGSDGASFEVVAGRIQGLASESCRHTENISDVLRKTASLSEKLSSEITLQLDSAGEELEGISGEIGTLINTLSAVNSNLCSRLSDINRSGWLLAADIGKFIKDLNVHTMVETVVNRVEAELGRIAAFPALQLAGDGGNGGTWHGLAVEYQPAFQKGPVWGTVQAGGLMADSAAKTVNAVKSGDEGHAPEDFGDNIELFL